MALLRMSLEGAAIITLVVIIRALGMNKLPKRSFLALWGVALCLLLVPFRIPVRTALPLSTSALVEQAVSGVPSVHPVENTPRTVPEEPSRQSVPGAQVSGELPPVVLPSPRPSPLPILWALGAALCTLYFAATHIRFRRKYRQAIPLEHAILAQWRLDHKLLRPIQVRVSDQILAPLSYGVIRPVILLPKQLDFSDERALRYILMHEFTHIRRWDVLTKGFMIAAVCLHWPNPMVWVMLVLANRDMELTCDEVVIHTFGEETRSQYALMLLNMEAAKSRLTPLCNGFSKHAIEERILSMKNMKKASVASIVLSILLVLSAMTALATSATPSAPPPPSSDALMMIGNMDSANPNVIYEPFGMVYDETEGNGRDCAMIQLTRQRRTP